MRNTYQLDIHSSLSTIQSPQKASLGASSSIFVSHPIDRSPGPSNSASDSLGLDLVYSFPNPILDIIFVHGLGGTPRGTWSWQHNPMNFWPPWLADEPELSRARIFTFGYNAIFTGQSTPLTILDFAKDLLLRMKMYSADNQEDSRPIGKLCPHHDLQPEKD